LKQFCFDFPTKHWFGWAAQAFYRATDKW